MAENLLLQCPKWDISLNPQTWQMCFNTAQTCCNTSSQPDTSSSVKCSWSRFMTASSYCSPNTPVFRRFALFSDLCNSSFFNSHLRSVSFFIFLLFIYPTSFSLIHHAAIHHAVTHDPSIKISTFLHRHDVRDVCRRRLGLFGHVARLRSDVPANSILRICAKTKDGEQPSQEWRRTCGRPSTTWIHQICHDTGVSATEALLLAEDKPFGKRSQRREAPPDRYASWLIHRHGVLLCGFAVLSLIQSEHTACLTDDEAMYHQQHWSVLLHIPVYKYQCQLLSSMTLQTIFSTADVLSISVDGTRSVSKRVPVIVQPGQELGAIPVCFCSFPSTIRPQHIRPVVHHKLTQARHHFFLTKHIKARQEWNVTAGV